MTGSVERVKADAVKRGFDIEILRMEGSTERPRRRPANAGDHRERSSSRSSSRGAGAGLCTCFSCRRCAARSRQAAATAGEDLWRVPTRSAFAT